VRRLCSGAAAAAAYHVIWLCTSLPVAINCWSLPCNTRAARVLFARGTC
jgi:hypothetical protein